MCAGIIDSTFVRIPLRTVPFKLRKKARPRRPTCACLRYQCYVTSYEGSLYRRQPSNLNHPRAKNDPGNKIMFRIGLLYVFRCVLCFLYDSMCDLCVLLRPVFSVR
jgi:hypothetical protein